MSSRNEFPSRSVSRPSISCIMPTYNRVTMSWADRRLKCQLVEEAVYSFLQQTYENSELIILNDTPGQVLQLEEPNYRVRIYNFPKRFDTLGDKCNHGLMLARGQYVTRWDDDDISFPSRLENCVKHLVAKPTKVLQVGGYWWTTEGTYKACEGEYGFQQDIYDTMLAKQVKYKSISNGEDQAIRKMCIEAVSPRQYSKYFPPQQVFHYIYRWEGTGSYHLSDTSQDTERRYREIGKLSILPVNYLLKPYWVKDYVEDTKCLLPSI